MKKLIRKVLKKKSDRIFTKTLKNPSKVQERVLNKILKQNKNTQFGTRYKFDKIHSSKAFQKRIPIMTSELLDSFISRCKQGEQKVLTNKSPISFVTTQDNSITTHVPITLRHIKHIHVSFLQWNEKIQLHKQIKAEHKNTILYISSGKQSNIEQGQFVNETHIPMQNLFSLHTTYIPQYLGQMDEFSIQNIHTNKEECIRQIVNLCLHKCIQYIIFESIEELYSFFSFIEQESSAIQKNIEKNNTHKIFSIKEFFSNLKGFVYIGPGLTIKEVKPIYKLLDTNVPVYNFGFYLPEGRISIGNPFEFETNVLSLTEYFFEFDEHLEDGSLKTVLIDKLTYGKTYMIRITTQDGLYRFPIPYSVKITGFVGKLPKVTFIPNKN